MSLDAVRALLAPARSIVVLTGAGISAESGVPTFRGPGGLWKEYRAEDLATPEAFAKDPRLVWEWYDWRRQKIAPAKPNLGHYALVTLEKRAPDLTLITQNVDGLHERAGTANVIRFHGSLWELVCRDRCPDSPAHWREEALDLPELPPRCPHCGGVARPGVIWFGEPLDPRVLSAAAAATDCDVFLAVGTSSVVSPAAGLLSEAAARGALTVEINPEATPASGTVDLAVSGRAEEVLDRVERGLTSDPFRV